MSMRFTEIGQQLRAYRLESGLRAEEIAARLGVSRAALYRYQAAGGAAEDFAAVAAGDRG